MIIYKITNIINGKVYIGQTVKSLKERIYGHKYSLKYNDKRRKCHALVSAFKKYGFENFKFVEVAKVNTIDEANKMEQELIKELGTLCPNGYNISIGGDNTFKSDIVKQKMIKNHYSKKDGYRNPNQRVITLYKNGDKIEIDGITKFCRENNYHHSEIYKLLNGKRGFYKDLSLTPNIKKKFSSNFVCRNGEDVEITNMKEFCKLNNYSSPHIYKLIRGEKDKYKDLTRSAKQKQTPKVKARRRAWKC